MFSRNTLAVAAISLTALLPGPQASALAPDRVHEQTPEQAGILYESVFFHATDGARLHGWFMPVQLEEGVSDDRPHPVVILVPPTDVNMGDMLWHYHMFFRGMPWHVLLFDWRGYGRSDDFPLDGRHVVDPAFIDDLHGAIDFVKTRTEWDGEGIAVFGFQAGAAVSMAVASQRNDISCLLLRGVYTTHAEMIANLNAVEPQEVRVVNREYPAALEPIEVAPKVETPVFLITGRDDPVTPPAMAHALFERLGDGSKKWIAPRASWKGGDIPEVSRISEFATKGQEWIRQHIGARAY